MEESSRQQEDELLSQVESSKGMTFLHARSQAGVSRYQGETDILCKIVTSTFDRKDYATDFTLAVQVSGAKSEATRS